MVLRRMAETLEKIRDVEFIEGLAPKILLAGEKKGW